MANFEADARRIAEVRMANFEADARRIVDAYFRLNLDR